MRLLQRACSALLLAGALSCAIPGTAKASLYNVMEQPEIGFHDLNFAQTSAAQKNEYALNNLQTALQIGEFQLKYHLPVSYAHYDTQVVSTTYSLGTVGTTTDRVSGTINETVTGTGTESYSESGTLDGWYWNPQSEYLGDTLPLDGDIESTGSGYSSFNGSVSGNYSGTNYGNSISTTTGSSSGTSVIQGDYFYVVRASEGLIDLSSITGRYCTVDLYVNNYFQQAAGTAYRITGLAGNAYGVREDGSVQKLLFGGVAPTMYCQCLSPYGKQVMYPEDGAMIAPYSCSAIWVMTSLSIPTNDTSGFGRYKEIRFPSSWKIYVDAEKTYTNQILENDDNNTNAINNKIQQETQQQTNAINNQIQQQTQQQTQQLKDTTGSDTVLDSAFANAGTLESRFGQMASLRQTFSTMHESWSNAQAQESITFPELRVGQWQILAAQTVPLNGWLPGAEDSIRLFNTMLIFVVWLRSVINMVEYLIGVETDTEFSYASWYYQQEHPEVDWTGYWDDE